VLLLSSVIFTILLNENNANGIIIPYFVSNIPPYSDNYSLAENISIQVDGLGIPIINYKSIKGIQIGLQRNPVTVANVALDNFNTYERSGNENSKKVFLHNANWIVDNAVVHGNYSLLEYHFPWPEYNLSAPWYSAMAQARALQVMIRAHEITGDDKYLDTAKNLLNALYIEAKDGGVTYKTDNNGWWYEEFAGAEGKQPQVLNGMMYTLVGLNDYYQYTNDLSAKYLFDQGITALKTNLPKYENPGNYSKYYLLGTANPLGYHKLNIKLLGILFYITSDEMFRTYYFKWTHYTLPLYLHGQKCRLNC
jgi:D-glucuronyl C5-epimerase C-terminus